MIDTMGTCVLESRENCEELFRCGGLLCIVQKWCFSKYLRVDAVKLLSYAMTACSARHVQHLIEETPFLPVVFTILV